MRKIENALRMNLDYIKFEVNVMNALDEMFYWLKRVGLNHDEICKLLAIFLEQEALPFVEALKENTVLH